MGYAQRQMVDPAPLATKDNVLAQMKVHVLNVTMVTVGIKVANMETMVIVPIVTKALADMETTIFVAIVMTRVLDIVLFATKDHAVVAMTADFARIATKRVV